MLMSKPKLLDQVRAIARLKHLSLKTEQAYVNYIRRFIVMPQLCAEDHNRHVPPLVPRARAA